MDVLTIVWGWIGGKKKGAAPPPVISSKARISILDFQLLIPVLIDNALSRSSMLSALKNQILITDELVGQSSIGDRIITNITTRNS